MVNLATVYDERYSRSKLSSLLVRDHFFQLQEIMSTHRPSKVTIPPVSISDQRAAAEQRRATYPYHFPRDRRQLGGKYSVAENARRLLRFFYLERRLMQALGAWTLSIREFEVKLETGRHIFYHADAARSLRDRLNEQEGRLKDIDAFRDREIDG